MLLFPCSVKNLQQTTFKMNRRAVAVAGLRIMPVILWWKNGLLWKKNNTTGYESSILPERYWIFFFWGGGGGGCCMFKGLKLFRSNQTCTIAQFWNTKKKNCFWWWEVKHPPSLALTPTRTLSVFVFHRQPSDPHNIVTAQLHCQWQCLSVALSLAN